MKNMAFITKSRTAVRLLAVVMSFALLLPGGAAWGVLQPPLKKVTVPVPRTNAELAQPQFAVLSQFVKDVPSAIALGKALFWDMQVGSNGAVACASCHYKAGADPINIRSRNQLHPGPGNVFDVKTGPDSTLTNVDFPFFQIQPTDGRVGFDTITDPILGTAPTATITRNFNDVVGSQGIPLTVFDGLVLGSAVESSGTPTTHPIFGNHRQVTGRNTPSAINAVFNFANFWDGRANNIFNGVNPIGPLDQNARIWINNAGNLVQQQIAIPNASLASQAVGPPLSDVEMSYVGRTFPELGRKMLNNNLVPLGQQLVHADDSVLGTFSNSPAPGLNNNNFYRDMIQAAFQNNLWDSAQNVTINTRGVDVQFTQIEANFSLFWGLAIMLYESTLVSDQTPFDRFQLGNMNALSLGAQLGFTTFDSKCAVCHSGAEFSDAVIGSSNIPNCVAPDCNPVSFTTDTNHKLILLNQTNILGAKSDTGFFNIAVRPTADDPGRGAGTPAFPFPLSFSRLAEVPGLPFPTPVNPPFAPTTDAVEGSFKTPGLRNVELNPPYFHNGSALTLIEVVDFYTRGGNFPINLGNPTGNRELALAVQPLGKLRGGGTERGEVVLFLQSLTDERVRQEKAPFDHPELRIPNGDGAEIILPATGGAIPPVQVGTFTLNNPFTAPTTSTFPVIGGFVDSTATVEVTVAGLAPAAAKVLGNAWSYTFTGLPLGNNNFTVTATSLTGDTTMAAGGTPATKTGNFILLPTALVFGEPFGAVKQTNATITVGAKDLGGRALSFYRYKLDTGGYSANEIHVADPIVLSNLSDDTHTLSVIGGDSVGNWQPETSPTTVSWRVKSIPPTVTVEPFPLPTRETSQTVTGTISELGIVPQVTADTGATVGPATVVTGGGAATWSCNITGLKKGANNITVTATDIAQNVGSATTSITIILPDGCFKGTTTPDIGDAIKALRIAVGTDSASLPDMLHGDVAPLDVSGVPVGDGAIDAIDALMILKKVVGLVNF